MIRSIAYANFKLLSEARIQFGALTVLTGTNAAGKSSVMQSILLARAASLSENGYVALNDGSGLNLGSAADVVSLDEHGARTSSKEVHFAFEFSSKRQARLTLQAGQEERYLKIQSNSVNPEDFGAKRSGGFSYISAARLGAVDSEELPSVAPELLQIGARGEHAAALLTAHDQTKVPTPLEHPSAPKLRLAKQAEAWLGDLVPHVRMRTELSAELGRVGIRFLRDDITAEWLKPANFGFGASYCLPIIVAGLLADESSLLLIDGPEGHLHPSGQSAMGQFLALVASTGAQVVIETHSDHILNGIRLAALKNKAPPSQDIVINHFSRDEKFRVTPISITDRGELSERPSDFFDQTERDLAEIVCIRFPGVSGS